MPVLILIDLSSKERRREMRVIYMIVREDRQRKDYRCRLSEGNRRGPCDRLRDNL